MSAERAVGRQLSIPAWIGVVLVYLVVIKLSGLLLAPDDAAVSDLRTGTDVLRTFVLPIGVSLLYAVAVISWLG